MIDFTRYNPNSQGGTSLSQAALSSEALFFQRIYTWMFAGLALTAATSYVLSGSEAFIRFMYGSFLTQILAFVLLIGLVSYLSARIESLSPTTAKVIFLVYATLMGAVMAGVALVYSPTVIFKTFLTTSAVYGAMALYGALTKRSLQGWGSFLIMGVFGIFIAMLVNMFVNSSALDLAISVIGVLIFSGLTAYDHQRLRVLHATGLDGTADGESRQVIMGALTLYLNFINLFFMLLRLFGGRN